MVYLSSADRKPVGLVIGAGGTAHAACYALTQLSADVYIYNRTPGTAYLALTSLRSRLALTPIVIANTHTERAQHLADRFVGVKGLPSTPEDLERLAGEVDVVISTVPPTANFTLPAAFFQRGAGGGLVVVELVYWPRFTPLLEQVRQSKAGQEGGEASAAVRVEVVEGIEILLAQGLAQFEIWTKREAPRAAIVEKIVATFKDGLYASPLPTSFA
jgi:pentafunctional AROM polypeptide